MVPYLGDFLEDATVVVMFNTFTSDDPSASVTIGEFVNTDVHIYKDGGLTQRNNAAGVAVDVDVDTFVGVHSIIIDTSDDTVGGFWVTGSDYHVVIEGTTVDGATINACVAHFSIENRFMRGTDSAALASVLGAAVGASISADIAEVKTETASIQTETTALDTLTKAAGDGDLAAILKDTGTDGVVLKAAGLAADAVDEILDEEVDNDGTAITLRGAMKLILAVLAGKSSGGGTATVVFRDINDAKNRISATVDADGNRTAVGTRDAS